MTGNDIKKLSIQSFMLKAGRIVLIALSILLACILILVSVLMAWSPGKPKPFLGDNGKVLVGSISEKIYLNITCISFVFGFAQGVPVARLSIMYPGGWTRS